MISFGNYGNDKIFYIVCKHCFKEYAIHLNEDDYDRWNNGDCYIQDCLDYLTAGQRELLISHTCNDCWKKFYPED